MISSEKNGRMMTNAYNKIYLDDAMHNLGVMLDYGTMAVGDASAFFDRFLVSGLARQFGNGNPKYVAGMSGIELAQTALWLTGGVKNRLVYAPDGRSSYYWTGWAFAYLQWYTGNSFERLVDRGMTIERLLSMYHLYHEVDMTKFIDEAMSVLSDSMKISRLKRQRRLIDMTQKELAARSGVSLRMIQAYEQNCQDISKAEAGTLLKLARTLSCSVEDLL